MSMNRDYYKESKDIAAELNSMDLSTWSERISDCIDSGSTATEIFMCLRHTSYDLIKSNALQANEELAQKVQSLADAINLALQ